MVNVARRIGPFVSSKIVRRDSPTHGAGVFAVEAIAAGEPILEFTGHVTHATVTDFTTYHLQIGEELYIGPSGDLDDLVNHSCEPNAGYIPESAPEHPLLIAKREIAPGEEITMDYGAVIDEPDFAGFPCSCGVSNCRGMVLSFRELSDVKKQSLRDWVMPYLREKYFR